ncbi:hypothetical protein GCM10009839_13930 [Catenulispora yoronensis]|uniref:Uncharacterized protein n=1 Tax=Catenulispora yoronensis TaxID=450799 RepID=A0ABN2TTR9_9ACTN
MSDSVKALQGDGKLFRLGGPKSQLKTVALVSPIKVVTLFAVYVARLIITTVSVRLDVRRGLSAQNLKASIASRSGTSTIKIRNRRAGLAGRRLGAAGLNV